MKRRVISVVLLFVIAVSLASCKIDNKPEILNKKIVVSPSIPGHVVAAHNFKAGINGDYIEYSSSSDAVMAVINGKADYVVLDEYSGYIFEKENDAICFLEKCDYNIEYSACFSNDNNELCQKFNEVFEKLKKDGTINKIKNAVYNNEQYVTGESTGVNGTLVMVCDPVFENRVCFDENGVVTGVDVYIAKEVCNYLGYTLVIKTVSFDELFLSLDNGDADFIMSCIERTEQRAEHYLFSEVYATYDYNVYKLR